MSFFNDDDSFSYDYDSLNNQTIESETQYLKDKLIETHQKLMRQLSTTKQLEEKLYRFEKKADSLEKENEHLQTKYAGLHKKFEMDRAQGEKVRILEMKIAEVEKKNDLLKGDLEGMRTKMLNVMVEKNNLEEEVKIKDDQFERMNQKASNLITELRDKNDDMKYLEKQFDSFKKKYEGLIESNKKIENDLHEVKRKRKQSEQKAFQFQALLRQERQKNAKILNDIVNIQAEHKSTLNRMKQMQEQCESYKDEIYFFQNKQKTENRTAQDQLEKLKSELNNMSSMYKQKEKELEILKRKPIDQLSKRKKNFEHTKQFVHKLESEQNVRRTGRYNSGQKENSQYSYSPVSQKNRKYKQQKQSSLIAINEVGDMETVLLSCNLEKKKILAEMDKIDDTKVKNRQMINRRRRLEDDLRYQEDKIFKIKEQLKKMKAL